MSSVAPGDHPVDTPAPRRTHVRTLIVTEFMTFDGVMEIPVGQPTHPHGLAVA